MILRFLQSSVLAVSTALLSAACQRESEPVSQNPSPSSSVISFEPRDWRTMLEGCSSLPVAVESSLQIAVQEDNLAGNPRTALNERLPGTVSMERHQRLARAHYEQALQGLPEGECTVVRRRLQGRVTMLGISIDSLQQINGRLSLGE